MGFDDQESKQMGLIVYTGGTFDLFHRGHVEFLKRSATFGELVVSLNTDEFIAAYKGKPPIMSYDERAAVLEACRYVDYVMPNTGGADSKPAIEAAEPDLIVIGSDWAIRDYHAQMNFTQEWLDERGIGLIYLPYTKDISSTEIKRRLSRGR
jgi:glycerol-3-phosphate cytidylyltransferase